MGIEYDVREGDNRERQMYVAEVVGMADGTPLLGDKVDVLHDTPRKYDDQISGDNHSGMLLEYGEVFQLGFTLAVGHDCRGKVKCEDNSWASKRREMDDVDDVVEGEVGEDEAG